MNFDGKSGERSGNDSGSKQRKTKRTKTMSLANSIITDEKILENLAILTDKPPLSNSNKGSHHYSRNFDKIPGGNGTQGSAMA
jgi:hypothetical protein